jgi:uncharacterized membrane protein
MVRRAVSSGVGKPGIRKWSKSSKKFHRWLLPPVNSLAVVVIVIGAVQAIASPVAGWLRTKTPATPLVVFRGFAGWLVLALEFLLAADILKTAISPTWNDIGQLAAIAAIRTFLNYSLGHDLRHTP